METELNYLKTPTLTPEVGNDITNKKKPVWKIW